MKSLQILPSIVILTITLSSAVALALYCDNIVEGAYTRIYVYAYLDEHGVSGYGGGIVEKTGVYVAYLGMNLTVYADGRVIYSNFTYNSSPLALNVFDSSDVPAGKYRMVVSVVESYLSLDRVTWYYETEASVGASPLACIY